VHGRGLTSLPVGLADLAMPTSRQRAVHDIVSEILTLNGADDFVWYLPPATPELSCYWDAAATNLLWITTVGVHIKRNGLVRPLPRSFTYEKQDGDYVGWLLPGAEPGGGGGTKRPEVATAVCPATSLRQPAGRVCPECDVAHG
jgi:hypothetical protein